MQQITSINPHFLWMIFASFLLFFVVIAIVIGKNKFREKLNLILLLFVIVVIFGMLFGKYGATWGLPWWIYYPVPMLMNVLLPPILFKNGYQENDPLFIFKFLIRPGHSCIFLRISGLDGIYAILENLNAAVSLLQLKLEDK